MRNIFHISLTLVLIAAAVILPAFADRTHRGSAYREFVVEVLNPSERSMISQDQISALAETLMGRIESAYAGQVDLDRLEHLVSMHPYVSACEVYRTLDGKLVLKAIVREPLVRVVNADLQQFLIDTKGFMMPLDTTRPWRLQVASGNIPDRYVSLDKSEKFIGALPDTSVIPHVYRVAWHVSRDEFLDSFIDQIFVNDRGEIELVPKLGNHNIILGSGEGARDKLENLKSFYLQVMNRIDWNTYKTINLKYENQVVCSK